MGAQLVRFSLAAWLLLVSAPSLAGETASQSPSGSWQGDAVEIRWRETRRTAYRPEVLILITNLTDEPIATIFDWDAHGCGDRVVPLDPSARSFVRQLLAEPSLGNIIQGGHWDAWVFPRGLPMVPESKARETCSSRIQLRVRKGDRTVDRFILTLPVLPPPPGKHE